MRTKTLWDEGWRFHRGDIDPALPNRKGTVYVGTKTERAKQGPACKDYLIPDDFSRSKEHIAENWEKVTLPHDYHAGDGYDPAANEALGFCNYENAWYIRRFCTEAGDEQKRLTLYFEGVAGRAEIWLNGCLMKHNSCGYVPFEVDITDTVRHDAENVLSVYVNTRRHEGWWYEGGGINRHVWCIKTEKTAVELYGVYVKPERNADNTWTVHTETTLRNDTDGAVQLRVENTVLDGNGKEVQAAVAHKRIACREKGTTDTVIGVNAPQLWSPESPCLYTMRTRVYRGHHMADEVLTRFGLREMVLHPEKGLYINNKHYKIKGFCAHESVGFCGRAVPDNLQRYRVQLMKEMGANGYRTAHYPHSEAMMDALDEAGFIVMDETRWFESTEEGLAQLEILIRRDRNRPSVFFWSLGNEEYLFTDDRGRRIFKTMKALAKKLDDRPVLGAVAYDLEKGTIWEDADLCAINYKWDHYDNIHQMYPDKPVLSSECGATGTTRGWPWSDDTARGFRTLYDADTNNAFRSRERTWRFIYERDWLMGGYHWNLNEYRGEAAWPRVCSCSGAVDLYLQKKDAFYQHQALFFDPKTRPVIHLLPHWSFEGLEGQSIRVVAYSNQPRVELFLNGESRGACTLGLCEKGEWQVPYAPGKLEVRAYDGSGKTVAVDRVETAGKPYALTLTPDTVDVSANGRDMAILTCRVVDERGNTVPDAEVRVRFIAEGGGSICATGASNTDHTPITSPDRTTWAGLAAAAVRMNKTGEPVTVTVTAPGLRSARFTFTPKTV